MQGAPGYRVGYFTYYSGSGLSAQALSELPTNLFTHIIYFYTPYSDLAPMYAPGQDEAQWVRLRDWAHANGAKVMMCYNTTDLTVLSDANRANTVHLMMNFIWGKGYDGIDIDIETSWPQSTMVNFVTALRDSFTARGGQHKFISSYATFGTASEQTTWAACEPSMDWVNVSAYDIVGSWTGYTSHYSPLFAPIPSHSGDGSNIDASLNWWRSRGYPRSKLLVGGTADAEMYVGGSGLCLYAGGGCTGGAALPGQTWTGQPAIYADVKFRDNGQNWQNHPILWDNNTQSSYISVDNAGSAGDTLICFNNGRALARKWRYASDSTLGGVYIWEGANTFEFWKPQGQQRWSILRELADSVNAVQQPPVPPSPPALATPVNGATGVVTNPTLTWNSSAGAATYRVQISTSATFSTIVTDQSNIGSTSYTVSGLTASTTYYWHVSASNSAGTSAFSTAWSFTTAVPLPPPVPPVLALPANGATGIATNPTITWNSSTGAVSYHLQVSTSSTFTTTVVDQNNIGSTSYAASGLLFSTTYYWRVSASNTSGTSAYSTTWSFTTAAPPPPPAPPVLASPVNGATGVPSNPMLTWNTSTGATSYRVQVSTDAAFGTTVVDRSGLTAASCSVTGLAPNTRYYWHVNATNGGGTSAYSVAWNFTTSATPSGLVAAYAFDEGTGSAVADASGHGLTGTISGAAWTTQGRYTNALSFDGVGSYVDLGNPSSLQITGSMTLSAWVKATGNPGDDGQIIAKSDNSNGWQLKSSPDTGPQTFGIAIASSSSRVQRYSTTVRSLNVWYHVAGVFNAAAQTLDIYVNGVLDNGVLSGTVPASQSDAALNVNVGRRTGGYNFNGLIDEVRVYNRALTQAEIQSDMTTPLTGQPLPPAPQCLAPANWATGQPTSLSFRWNRVASAAGYHLQVSSDSLFSSPIMNDASLTDTARQVTNLAQATTYYWRVSSRSSAGEGAYSTVWSFRTQVVLPPAPVLVSPVDTASNLPVPVSLSWRECTGATVYQVQLATDSLFNALLVNDSTVVDSNRQVSGLSNMTRYFWRVRAKNVNGCGSFSSSWRFRTASNVPAVPSLLSPANGATGVPTNPTLTWNASSGATSYRVQVSTGSAFSTTVVDQSGITATSLTIGGLTSNTVYYWHVNATNASGTSAFSGSFNFTTVAPAVTGLVASYAFNEGAGTTVADASGNGLTGSISGATWTTQGKYRNALSFNGTRSYVDLKDPTQLRLTGSMTLSAWVYATANPGDDGQIIAKSDNNNGWQLKSSPDTGPHTFGIAISNGSSHIQRYSAAARSLNVWYHVAGVYNATARTLDIYVNGVLNNGKLSGTVPASQSNANVNVNIGRRTGGYYFRGTIDEVHIFNRALSQVEIQADMNAISLPPTIAGLEVRKGGPFSSDLSDGGNMQSAVENDPLPEEFQLDQNYPNPFNPSTIIHFSVPAQGYVNLSVYNILGQKVSTLVDGVVDAGWREVRFSGDNLANGVYVYVLRAGSFSETKRMVLLK